MYLTILELSAIMTLFSHRWQNINEYCDAMEPKCCWRWSKVHNASKLIDWRTEKLHGWRRDIIWLGEVTYSLITPVKSKIYKIHPWHHFLKFWGRMIRTKQKKCRRHSGHSFWTFLGRTTKFLFCKNFVWYTSRLSCSASTVVEVPLCGTPCGYIP